MCFSCNRTLTPAELFPVLSFLFQKGRCKKCKTKLSWQYPAVELLTGLLFALSFQKVFTMGIFNVPFVWIIMSILVIIIIYDLRHRIIPDQFSYLFAILTFIRLFFSDDGRFILPTLEVLFAGPLLALPFYLIWMVSKGRWMGLGDAKLSLGIGWFLAVYAPFSPMISNTSVFLYAFWIGTLFFILIAVLGFVFKKLPVLGLKSEIPFAPFLILGLLIVFLFRYNVASLIFNAYLN